MRVKRWLTCAVVAMAAVTGVQVAQVAQAPTADAASGTSSIYNCTNRTITATRSSASVVCNTPGTRYRFEVLCGWYSAGRSGTYWRSSPWTADRYRATATCGAGHGVVAIGRSVFWSTERFV